MTSGTAITRRDLMILLDLSITEMQLPTVGATSGSGVQLLLISASASLPKLNTQNGKHGSPQIDPAIGTPLLESTLEQPPSTFIISIFAFLLPLDLSLRLPKHRHGLRRALSLLLRCSCYNPRG